jgi:hypothetical protein
MDQAKTGLVRMYLLNGEARRFSAKFARPPYCESPLKFLCASLFFGNLETAWDGGDESSLWNKVCSFDRCNNSYFLNYIY